MSTGLLPSADISGKVGLINGSRENNTGIKLNGCVCRLLQISEPLVCSQHITIMFYDMHTSMCCPWDIYAKQSVQSCNVCSWSCWQDGTNKPISHAKRVQHRAGATQQKRSLAESHQIGNWIEGEGRYWHSHLCTPQPHHLPAELQQFSGDHTQQRLPVDTAPTSNNKTVTNSFLLLFTHSFMNSLTHLFLCSFI